LELRYLLDDLAVDPRRGTDALAVGNEIEREVFIMSLWKEGQFWDAEEFGAKPEGLVEIDEFGCGHYKEDFPYGQQSCNSCAACVFTEDRGAFCGALHHNSASWQTSSWNRLSPYTAFFYSLEPKYCNEYSPKV